MAHILLAPDSFKGTMTALEYTRNIGAAVKIRLPPYGIPGPFQRTGKAYWTPI